MTTILQRHYDHVLAAKRAQSKSEPAAAKRARAGLSGLLATHRAELKLLKARARKIAAKHRFLPDYASYVTAVLAADAGGADDVLMTVMVWRLDTGDYAGALEIAAYALRHQVPLPTHFARDLPDLLVEEIAEQALAALDNGGVVAGPGAVTTSLVNYSDALTRALVLTADADLHDVVAAKAHKALGRLAAADAPEQAIEHLETALRLDPKGAGVKTELARLHKRCGEMGSEMDTGSTT